MKKYKTPAIMSADYNNGFPTVLAVAAVSTAVGAASVALGKLIGDDRSMHKNDSIKEVEK